MRKCVVFGLSIVPRRALYFELMKPVRTHLMAMMATKAPVESPSPLVPSPSVLLLSMSQVGSWDT